MLLLLPSGDGDPFSKSFLVQMFPNFEGRYIELWVETPPIRSAILMFADRVKRKRLVERCMGLPIRRTVVIERKYFLVLSFYERI